MPRSAAQKMGIRQGSRAYLLDAPDRAVRALELPALEIAEGLDGYFDYLHLFSNSRAGMDATFPKLKAHLKPSGMLWLSWPKAGKLHTDLTLQRVIEIGYGHGLVESTCLRVDDTWAGLKFTHPKKGKIYKNSYGELPEN